MTGDPVARWALAVRVLALLSFVLLVLTFFEGRALRAARSELQQLRSSCPQQASTMPGQPESLP